MSKEIILDLTYMRTATLHKGIIKDCEHNIEIIHDLAKLLYLNNYNFNKNIPKSMRLNKKV